MNPEIRYDDLDYLSEGIFVLNGKPFTGTAIDRDVEGRKESEVLFVDGHEDGVARSWHANGQLRSEIPYRLGVAHGSCRKWYEDGALKSEEKVEFGILMKRVVRDPNGDVVESYERRPSDPLHEKVLKQRQGSHRLG